MITVNLSDPESVGKEKQHCGMHKEEHLLDSPKVRKQTLGINTTTEAKETTGINATTEANKPMK